MAVKAKGKLKVMSHTSSDDADVRLSARGTPKELHADGSTSHYAAIMVCVERQGLDLTVFLKMPDARKLIDELRDALEIAETTKPCTFSWCTACGRRP